MTPTMTPTMTPILGVDPGLSGALALIIGGLVVLDMPTTEVIRNKKKKRDVDYVKLGSDLSALPRGIAYVERVASMQGQGLSSTFAFGKATGAVIGALAALGWTVKEVPPATWKKRLDLIGEEKSAALGRAREAFPKNAHLFARKKDCGRADAALIALYGLIQETKE